MDDLDIEKTPEGLLAYVENLFSEIWDFCAEHEIPLQVNVHPLTLERLASSLLYDVLSLAGSIETKQAEQLSGKLSLEKALAQIYPMLGNAIQVAYAYVNGFIDRRELAEFYCMMSREGTSAMRDAGPKPDTPFFTPSSFHKRPGQADQALHVLSNRQTINKHLKLFRRLEKKYKRDKDLV